MSLSLGSNVPLYCDFERALVYSTFSVAPTFPVSERILQRKRQTLSYKKFLDLRYQRNTQYNPYPGGSLFPATAKNLIRHTTLVYIYVVTAASRS